MSYRPIILLGTFLALAISLVGQAPMDSESKSKLMVGLNGGVQYSYRFLKPDFEISSSLLAQERDRNEKGLTSGIFGVSLLFMPNPKLGLETGLITAMEGYDSGGHLIMDSLSTYFGDSIEVQKRFRSLEIPIRFNLFLMERKIRPFISLGGSIDLIRNANIKTTVLSPIPSENTEPWQVEKPVVLSIMAGGGVKYFFTDKLSLDLQFLLTRSLSDIASFPIKEIPFSIIGGGRIFYSF